MESHDRTDYAFAYSMIVTMRELDLQEFTTASELNMLQNASSLGDAEKERAQADIAKLQGYNKILSVGSRQLAETIQSIGIRLTADDNELLREEATCPMPATMMGPRLAVG